MIDPNAPNFLSGHIPPDPSASAELQSFASPSVEPQPFEPQPFEPERPRRRWGRWIFLLSFLLIVALLAPLIYGGVRAGLAAQRVRATVADVQVKLTARDFVGAEADLNAISEDLTEMRDGLQSVGGWRFVPWIGTQIRALQEVARVGETTIGGVREIVAVLRTMNDAFASVDDAGTLGIAPVAPHRSFRDLPREEKRAILARLAEGLPKLRVAREKISIAREAWEAIPTDELFAPVRTALAPIAKQLPELSTRMDEAVSFLEILLPMSGYPKPQTYLVLLQNADEMRPTGGFIGTVGTVSVDAGDLTKVDFQDVYAIDDPVIGKWNEPLPEPMKRGLGVGTLYFRDANWSPDVPQTAARLLDFYKRERTLAGAVPTKFDGVIALEPGFFTQLLNQFGSLHVDGKTFTAENFFDLLQYDVEIGYVQTGVPLRQRKEIVAKVGMALIDELMNQPAAKWPGLLQIVSDAFRQKDIMIVSQDPSLQRVLDARNWSGRTQTSAQDFLWVVDANLGAFKTDGVMDKTVTYSVDRTGSEPTATVTLTYVNTNRRIDWRYTRYRDYVRVYVPEGAELLSSDGAMLNDRNVTGGKIVPGPVDVMRELGKTVFGAFWAVEPGETRTLRFTYRLPPNVFAKTGVYHLLVQKQPGSNTRLTLDLNLGKKLLSAMPPEDPKEFGDQRYRASVPLDQDRSFDVTW